MSDSHQKPGNEPSGQPAFEASIRQHRHLMEQMADREHWETDPLWLKAGRIIGIALISTAAVTGLAIAVLVLATG